MEDGASFRGETRVAPLSPTDGSRLRRRDGAARDAVGVPMVQLENLALSVQIPLFILRSLFASAYALIS